MIKYVMTASMITVMLTAVAPAQLLVDPASSAGYNMYEAGAVLSLSTVTYETDDFGNGDIERTILGGYSAFGVTDLIDVYGALGMIALTKPEGWPDDGVGLLVAVGSRVAVLQEGPLRVHAYGQVQYISEDYGSSKFDGRLEATLLELNLGTTVNYALSEFIEVYGGLDLIPFMDAEFSNATSRFDDSLERDVFFGLRGGVRYDIGRGIWLRGEIALISETTLSVGAGTRF